MANQQHEKNYASVHYMQGERTNNETLKNKFNITNKEELEQVESEIVSYKQHTRPVYDGSIQSIKAIHKHLFTDLYSWAGEYRNYPTARDPYSSFAMPEFIENQIKVAQKKLGDYETIKPGKLELLEISKILAEFSNEFNAAHPFIDGNGRVNRLIVKDVAKKTGYQFRIDKIKTDEWNEASRESMVFFRDDKMIKIMIENLALIKRD